jgi:hypothetical protein
MTARVLCAGLDADRQPGRLLGGEAVDRLDGRDVVVAVDDHVDRGCHLALPSWVIALSAICGRCLSDRGPLAESPARGRQQAAAGA